MTKAEAEKIKTGQKILIEAIFDRIDEDGDAAIEYTNSVSDCECGFIDPKHIVGLITPVEELEQYHINEIYDIDDGKLIGYEVTSGDTSDSIFYGGENHLRTIEQAKAAAAEECDRLNTEYRKSIRK